MKPEKNAFLRYLTIPARISPFINSFGLRISSNPHSVMGHLVLTITHLGAGARACKHCAGKSFWKRFLRAFDAKENICQRDNIVGRSTVTGVENTVIEGTHSHNFGHSLRCDPFLQCFTQRSPVRWCRTRVVEAFRCKIPTNVFLNKDCH